MGRGFQSIPTSHEGPDRWGSDAAVEFVHNPVETRTPGTPVGPVQQGQDRANSSGTPPPRRPRIGSPLCVPGRPGSRRPAPAGCPWGTCKEAAYPAVGDLHLEDVPRAGPGPAQGDSVDQRRPGGIQVLEPSLSTPLPRASSTQGHLLAVPAEEKTLSGNIETRPLTP